jgi:Mrp family chromosome partitioning ATPase
MANNDQSCQSLRVLLDAMLPPSAMVVVSSAGGEDGQAELACGLAHAFRESGRKTALISLYGKGDAQPSCITDVDPRIFSGSLFQAPLTPIELDSLIADVRAEHEVVIVACPPVVTESASLHLCRIADGVLLAVRLGRKVTADDEYAVTQLQRVAATLLGVVAMYPPVESVTQSSDVIVAREQAFEATAIKRIPSLIAAALSPVLLINRLRGSSRPPAPERSSLR